MSHVRGKDTGPELELRKALWKAGFRYRVKSNLPGRPDIVFTGKRVAMFVDGCFWHGCPEHGEIPASNTAFWSKKISDNIDRDRRTDTRLRAMGWQVVRVWEHEVNTRLDDVLDRVVAALSESARSHLQV